MNALYAGELELVPIIAASNLETQSHEWFPSTLGHGPNKQTTATLANKQNPNQKIILK